MNLLALDLGTSTGWALRMSSGSVHSGTQEFRPQRFEGGGMRYLRFERWLDAVLVGPAWSEGCAVLFEEVRRHLSTDSAHAYGGFMATLTKWCERHGFPYAGVPVGTIKKHATGKGNAGKAAMIAAAREAGHDVGDGEDDRADALCLLAWAVSEGWHENKGKRDGAAGDAGVGPAPHRGAARRVQVGSVPVARRRVQVG